MSGSLGKRLLRLADALQRGLFDDTVDDAAGVPFDADVTAAPAPWRLDHPRANRSFVRDGEAIAFHLRRSRRRSIGFVVGAEGLVVSAPRWVALREIDAAVREKGAWIVARLVEQRELAARARAAHIVWADGASLRYLGEPVTLVLDPGLGAGAGVLEDAPGVAAPGTRRLRLGLGPGAAPERIRDAAHGWLQREALRVFAARAGHFGEQLGVRATRIALSSARTRWGSANANGSIRLNWRLIHHALPTIDYVVAHELAHLREMNHGPRFWKLVRSVVPDAEAARRELRAEAGMALD